MFKLIGILVAAIPVVLFLKSIFFRKPGKLGLALAEFKQQVDYVVWAILFMIGCVLLYSLAKFLLGF